MGVADDTAMAGGALGAPRSSATPRPGRISTGARSLRLAAVVLMTAAGSLLTLAPSAGATAPSEFNAAVEAENSSITLERQRIYDMPEYTGKTAKCGTARTFATAVPG